MPLRKTPLITDKYYHVFNRGVAKLPIFKSASDQLRMLELINYYRFKNPFIRYSYFIRLNADAKRQLLEEMAAKSQELVEIHAFCLMPNHFHLQLNQNQDGGISKFMGNFQNAYTRYFNTKHNRKGTLYELRFKNVDIDTDEELIHVSRYIHLNPLTSNVVSDSYGLEDYPWNSYSAYLGNREYDFIKKDLILNMFSNSIGKFISFTLDQKSYQRQLHLIKNLLLE